jgi:hypothetical protein
MRRLTVVASVCVLGALALPSSSAAEVECVGIQNCTTVTGPWVAVPPQQQLDEFDVTWGMVCPPGFSLQGSDWTAPNRFNFIVFLEQLSGFTIFGQQAGVKFIAANVTSGPLSLRTMVGCRPTSSARAAQSEGGRTTRIVTRRLQAGRVHRFGHGCRRGERLLASGHGVGFFQDSPPSARELRQLSSTRRERRGRVRVRVNTGPRVGDDERVEVQIHAVCRR